MQFSHRDTINTYVSLCEATISMRPLTKKIFILFCLISTLKGADLFKHQFRLFPNAMTLIFMLTRSHSLQDVVIIYGGKKLNISICVMQLYQFDSMIT